MSRWIGLPVMVVAAALVAACGVSEPRGDPVTFPPRTFGAAGSPTPAMERARAEIAGALGAVGILLDEPQAPYRPAEAARFGAAPRTVVRAVLPDDLTRGLISIYGFTDSATAVQAAREQAAYVGSPVGRVQFPTGTQFTIRQLDSTVIFYGEVTGASPDAQAADVAEALRTLGEAVPVPG